MKQSSPECVHLSPLALESVLNKTRKVVLSDTTARSSGFHSVVSRIFWPRMKIRSFALEDREHSVEALRHSLFCAINYFYTDSHQNAIVHDILKKSDILTQKGAEMDHRVNSFKIMRDVVEGKEDRMLILDRIKNKKKSVLGYFSQRQRYNQVKRMREGPGEWRGQIANTHLRIIIRDQTARKIIVNGLHDFDFFGHALTGLFSDLNLHHAGNMPSANNLYLKVGGRLLNSMVTPLESTPIEVNPELKVDILEKVSMNNWDVVSTPYNIRLVMHEDLSSPAVTLLSETLTANDWSPDMKYYDQDTSTLIKNFASNKEITENELYHFVNTFISASQHDRKTMYRISRKTKVIGDIIDCAKLRKMIINKWNYLSGGDEIASYEKVRDASKSLTADIITQNEIDQFAFMFSGFGDVAMPDFSTFAPPPEEDDEKAARQMAAANALSMTPDFDEEGMLEYLEDINSSRLSSFEIREIRDYAKMGMSGSNRFLNNLFLHLKRNYPHIVIDDFADRKYIEIEDSWGALLSAAYSFNFEYQSRYDYLTGNLLPDDHWANQEESDDEPLPEGMEHDSFASLSVVATRERIRALQDAQVVENINMRNATHRAIELNKAHLKRLEERQKGMSATPMSLQQVDMSLMLYHMFLYLDQTGRVDLKYPMVFEDSDVMDPEQRRALCLSLVRMKLSVVLEQMQTEDYLDDVLFRQYRGALRHRILTEQFMDLLVISMKTEIVIKFSDKHFFKFLPSVPLSDTSDGELLEKLPSIVYNAEDHSVEDVQEGEYEGGVDYESASSQNDEEEEEESEEELEYV